MISCDLDTVKKRYKKQALDKFKGQARSIRINEKDNIAIVRWGPEYRVKTEQQAFNMIQSNMNRVKKWSLDTFNRAYDWFKIDGRTSGRIAVKTEFPIELEKAYVIQMAKEGNQDALDRIERNPSLYNLPGAKVDALKLGNPDPLMFQTTIQLRREILEGLNRIVRNFLRDSGLGEEISLVEFETYKEKYKAKFGKELDFVAFADIANNAIAFAQDKIDGTSILEEAMHFITYYLWDTDRFKRLRDFRNDQGVRWLETSKEWQIFADEYKELYRDKLGRDDWETLVDQEIITKILTNTTYDMYSGKNKDVEDLNTWQRLLRRVISWFKRLFGKRRENGEVVLNFPREVSKITKEIGGEFLAETLRLPSSALNDAKQSQVLFSETEFAEAEAKEVALNIESRLKFRKVKLSQEIRSLYNKKLKARKNEIIETYGIDDYNKFVDRLDYLLEQKEADLLLDKELDEIKAMLELSDLFKKERRDELLNERMISLLEQLSAVNLQIENKEYQGAIKLAVLGTPYIGEDGVVNYKNSIIDDVQQGISSLQRIIASRDSVNRIEAYPIAMRSIEYHDTFFPLIEDLETLINSSKEDGVFSDFSPREREDLINGINQAKTLFNQLASTINILWKDIVAEELVELGNTEDGQKIFEDLSEEEIRDLAHGSQYDINLIARWMATWSDTSPYQVQYAIKLFADLTNRVKRQVQNNILDLLETVDIVIDKDNPNGSLLDNPVVKEIMKKRDVHDILQLMLEFNSKNETTGYIANDINIGSFEAARDFEAERIIEELEFLVKDLYGIDVKIPKGKDPESRNTRNKFIYEYSLSFRTDEEKKEGEEPIIQRYNELWAKFYKEYTRVKKDAAAIEKQRKKELTVAEFRVWEEENYHTYTKRDGSTGRVPAGELVEPVEMFHNEDFKRLKKIPDFMKVYDKFMDYKEDSDYSLPEYISSNPNFKFRAPQIDINFFDSIYQASRWHSGKGIGARLRDLKNKVGYLFKKSFVSAADDELFKTDIVVDENLPSINTAPIRFIQMLEEPNRLSRDVAGTLMMYMGMAYNFKEMSEHMLHFNALVESAKRSKFSSKSKKKGVIEKEYDRKTKTHRNILPQGSSNTYEYLKKFMEIEIYGHRKLGWQARIGNTDVNVTKILEGLAKWKRDINLKSNYVAIVQGWVSAIKETGFEAFTGRNVDRESLKFAREEYYKNYSGIIKDYESPIKKNKISALMQQLGVLDNNYSQFKDLDKAKLARMIKNSSHYGTWRAADHPIRARLMIASMYNYRLIDGKWYTKEQFLEVKDKFGIRNNTVEDWEKHKENNMFNKVSLEKDGKGRPKLKWDKSVREADINNITNRVRILSRDVTTQKSDLDTALVDQTLWGTWLMMHKAFLRLGIYRRFKRRHRNYVTGKWEEGTWNWLGDMFMGKIDPKVLISKSKRADLRPEQREGLNRSLLEFMYLNASFLIALGLLHAISDDDEEKATLAFLTYLAIRNYQEASTFMWVEDLSQIVLRPIPGVDMIETFEYFWPFSKDNIWGGNREMRSGPYKDIRQKAIVKSLPGIRGIYETFPVNTPVTNSEEALPLKRTYIQNRVIGNAVPTAPVDWMFNFPKDPES